MAGKAHASGIDSSLGGQTGGGAVGVSGASWALEHGRTGSNESEHAGERSDDDDDAVGMVTPSVHGYSAALQFKPPRASAHAGSNVACCRSCGAMLAEQRGIRAGGVPALPRSPSAERLAASHGGTEEFNRHGGPLGVMVAADCCIPLPQYGLSSPARVCAQCFLAQTLLSYLKALQGRLASGGSFRRSAAAAARGEVEAAREAAVEMARVAALSGEQAPSLSRAAFAAVAPLLGDGGVGCDAARKAEVLPEARRRTWALLEGHALTVRAAAFLLHAPAVMECRDDDDDDGTAGVGASAAEKAAATGAGGVGRGSIFCALVARLLVLAQVG